MDRMIVAVFDPPTRAVDGQYALRRLDEACSIALYALALVDKAADGGVEIRRQRRDTGIATISGSAIGAIIGLLGGPAGAAPAPAACSAAFASSTTRASTPISSTTSAAC